MRVTAEEGEIGAYLKPENQNFKISIEIEKPQ